MNHLQAMVGGMSAEWQRERAKSQITLGDLISALEEMPADSLVANLHSPHSYRGYYEDLALTLGDGSRRASELLSECKAAMGRVFCGYKGGDFVMGELTPVWVAAYGRCGDKLTAIRVGGGMETAQDN